MYGNDCGSSVRMMQKMMAAFDSNDLKTMTNEMLYQLFSGQCRLIAHISKEIL